MSFGILGRLLMYDYRVLCYVFWISNPFCPFSEFCEFRNVLRCNSKDYGTPCGGIIQKKGEPTIGHIMQRPNAFCYYFTMINKNCYPCLDFPAIVSATFEDTGFQIS